MADFPPIYHVPGFACCLTNEDMEDVLAEFTAWTKKAINNVPRHLKKRMKFARRWCYSPGNIGVLVDIIAAAYRYQFEVKQEKARIELEPDERRKAQ